MVLAGSSSDKHPSDIEIANATVAALSVLRRAMPLLPGVAFLSGGQSEADAARRMREVVVLAQVWNACMRVWRRVNA